MANLLFFNLLFILSLVFNISGWPQGEGPKFLQIAEFRSAVLFGMTVLKFAWIYAFLEMTHQVIRKNLKKGFRRLYISVSSLLLLWLFITYADQMDTMRRMIAASIVVFIESLILAAALAALIVLIHRTHYSPEITSKRAVYGFAGIYIALFCLLIVSLILGMFLDLEKGGGFFQIRAAQMIAYNILPLLWLRRYSGTVGPAAVIGGGAPDRLFSSLSITPREQDIIRLMCTGKSNKDIGGELLLSSKTVRDHKSRIFRKVGVRSRVELKRVFRRLIQD